MHQPPHKIQSPRFLHLRDAATSPAPVANAAPIPKAPCSANHWPPPLDTKPTHHHHHHNSTSSFLAQQETPVAGFPMLFNHAKRVMVFGLLLPPSSKWILQPSQTTVSVATEVTSNKLRYYHRALLLPRCPAPKLSPLSPGIRLSTAQARIWASGFPNFPPLPPLLLEEKTLLRNNTGT